MTDEGESDRQQFVLRGVLRSEGVGVSDATVRVVGNPQGDDIRTARKDLTVTVH